MIAHIRKTDFKIQTVQEHHENVANLSRYFGKKASFSSMAELSGFLHDMGKSTEAFRKYIEHAVKGTDDRLEKIDHSTAGAKYLFEKYYIESPNNQKDIVNNFTVEIVGMVILSHHSGLQNFLQEDGSDSDFFRRVCKKDLPYYDEVKEAFLRVPGNERKVEELFHQAVMEMEEYMWRLTDLMKKFNAKVSPFVFFSLAMKYVFSCLIDADRTDARRFDEGDDSELFLSNQPFFEASYENLINYLERLKENSDANDSIDKLRMEMSQRCDDLAELPTSIYQLSIPTGGGKTLSSLRYALKHALKFKKERIIYVVPYTTILEQNADVVRNIVSNPDMVLEHHANIISDYTNEEDSLDYYEREKQKQMELARENWDYPIIFTTVVQFLNTFYAKGTRRARRLHNLTNAIIVFDEVQKVPLKHIPLFNCAVNFLHYFGQSSILLCTATQPSLHKTTHPLLLKESSEIVHNLDEVTKAFERVTIKNLVTNRGWSVEEISRFTVEKLKDKNSILIILNTKSAVLNLYNELKKDTNYNVYHLSTSMCPQHRKDILRKIINQLETPHSEKLICVSTQLIEAGVDIDFECVIRSLAGLDSIAQAAGRCNRHGKLEKGTVYIIRAEDENLKKLPEILLGQKVMEEDVLSREEIAENLLSRKAIETYFDFYYAKAEREIKLNDSVLNVPLIELIDKSQKYFDAVSVSKPRTFMRAMFKSLESRFQVIEAPTTGVIVPFNEEAKQLIALLNEDINDYKKLKELLRKAQMYSVNVYSHTLQQLVEADLIYSLYHEGVFALRDVGYHAEYGLSLEGEGKWEVPIY